MSTVVRKRLFALITFALSVVGSAGAASNALGPAFRIIREAVEKDEIPGAIVLVARGGTILRHEAYGLRDIENRLPFTTNTLCWIASITKPVTVAAAMTLVDVGKLALDDAIEKYLPEFREQTDTSGTHHVFTIRQLMSHTSGLVPNPPTRRSGWPIGGPLDDFWLQQKLPEIVQTIARSQLRFEPGSQFQYSNSALFVLGRVIEVVSGKPYAVYVKEKILEPLGMVDTHYAPPPTEAKRVATIYARRDGKRETIFRFNPAVMIANTAPDGGLFSYPSQLVPFLQMFLDDDGRVLSRSAVAEMLKEQPHGWGLGWSLQEGLFLHEGSSGTVAWADPKTRVIGVLFLQYRDQNKFDERLRKQFREAVRDAFADPKKPEAYFPPPESEGGWRKLEQPEDIRRLAGMDPDNLAELKKWLLDSDKRDFAAVVIRHGHIALEVERGISAKTDSRRVASVSKAICATVLAIASEQSQLGLTPRKMKFDDPAFQFIPWAQPLSDPRKESASTAYATSRDGIKWEKPTLDVRPGSNIWRGQPADRHKPNNVVLGYSRDGWHWSRPDRRAFCPVSDQQGDWNANNVQSAGGGFLVVGDNLYFYVSGRTGRPGGNKAGTLTTGLATLRRDGFASMDAEESGGTLTTRPVCFIGKHFFVNVNDPNGELRVEILNQAGQVMPRFAAKNCVPLAADKTLQAVRWKGAEDLSSLANQPVRFPFQLKNGKLYAFWVSPDNSGGESGLRRRRRAWIFQQPRYRHFAQPLKELWRRCATSGNTTEDR